MLSFNIEFKEDTLRTSFGDSPPTNAVVDVLSADSQLKEIKASGGLQGGSLLKINGPVPWPLAFTIGHSVFHGYGAVAVWDSKLRTYVVEASRSPIYLIGDLID